MPKGKQRGNKELKKPKKDRTAATSSAAGIAGLRMPVASDPLAPVNASAPRKRK